MEKIQVIQPTKLLAPYIKQYWFLRIDDVKQGFQRSIPAGCVALVFHKGNKIISSFHKGTQPQSYISGQISTYSDIEFSFFGYVKNEIINRFKKLEIESIDKWAIQYKQSMDELGVKKYTKSSIKGFFDELGLKVSSIVIDTIKSKL